MAMHHCGGGTKDLDSKGIGYSVEETRLGFMEGLDGSVNKGSHLGHKCTPACIWNNQPPLFMH